MRPNVAHGLSVPERASARSGDLQSRDRQGAVFPRRLSMTLRFCLPLGFGLLLAATVFAQSPEDAAGIAAGKTAFQQTCGFCHGPDARGASGPDLLQSPLVNRDINGNLIGQVVRNGRPGKGMPAFQLPENEIRQIADFLHAQIKSAASVAQHMPSEYPLKKLLVGNAGVGKSYFEKHCASCHSPTGDLAHIASKYSPFDLQTRIAFPSGVSPELTVKDSAGRIFKGKQVYADAFYVSLRDKNGWLHTWPRNQVSVTVHDPLAAHERLLKQYTNADLHNLFAYLETLK
jgi:cytochrome c oxidase cbb3-type subunit 3